MDSALSRRSWTYTSANTANTGIPYKTDSATLLLRKCGNLWTVEPDLGEKKRYLSLGNGNACGRSNMGQTLEIARQVLGSRTAENAQVKSPSQKMQEEVKKQVVYWQTEFDMDKWQVAGVMFDIAMDLLMVIETDDDDDDE